MSVSQKALARLVSKLTKENLWIYVVRLLMERPMYGYEIAKEVRARFNIDITNVGVYMVLYKMERDGLIETFTSGGSKMYRLRPETVELWLKARDFISAVLRDVFGCGVDCGTRQV
ncbi:MAG: PadR family transcriptional regulator [Vulcanisaeta sp.]|jgi:DNA-binding PadR family transcriptional regulator|nr:PadR family transcriptional regulator [Vulcanisaeta sp.]MCG2886848.1 PadR family transcriptional regulator [Vulcanisaeta sp.]MCG2895055.1 PadR family transcriptional regulator [Vulcanisaeta sp.]